MVNSYEFLGRVRLLSSLVHGSETVGGNESLLRREKFVASDGSIIEVPVVSGNAIRGTLRDIGMRHFCSLLGDDVKLSMAAFYFLFSGGSPRVRTSGAKTENLPWIKKLRELIPLVSVFGGVDVQWIPGRLKVGKMIPICKELEHILPVVHRGGNLPSIYDLIQQEMYTRRDDCENEKNARFLRTEVRTKLESGVSGKELADSSVSAQMIYYMETLCAGTELSWRVFLEDVTMEELGAFAACLTEWAKRPYIGGRSGVGHGEVILEGEWFRVDPREGKHLAEWVVPSVDAYVEMVRRNKEEICSLLSLVEE